MDSINIAEKIIDNIDELVDKISLCSIYSGQMIKPCTDIEILFFGAEFKLKFGCSLPDPYKLILLKTNGILYSNLVIWPAKSCKEIEDTIFEANHKLHRSLPNYIFFALRDQGLYYAFDATEQQYCMIDKNGSLVQKFINSQDFFLSMLDQAWENYI